MLSATARAVIIVVAALVALGGLLAASVGGGIGALWVTVTGVAIVVAVLVERERYRSEAADQPFEPIGPGGGEPTGHDDRTAVSTDRRAVRRSDHPAQDARSRRSEHRRAEVRGGGLTSVRSVAQQTRDILADPKPSQAGQYWRPDAGVTTTQMTAVDERNVGSARPRTRAARQPVDRTPYINRELSWLEYSARVLFEARDPRNPLIERVKFVTIFAGMLDEFFQIRVAGLRQQVNTGIRVAVAGWPNGSRTDRGCAHPSPGTRRRPRRALRRHPALAPRRGHRDRRLRVDPRAPRSAASTVPRRDLPGAHAAGRRSRPSRSRTSRR